MHVHICSRVCVHLHLRMRMPPHHRVKLSYMVSEYVCLRPPLMSFIITFEFIWATRVRQYFFFLRSVRCTFWVLSVRVAHRHIKYLLLSLSLARSHNFIEKLAFRINYQTHIGDRSETVSKPYLDHFSLVINDDFIGLDFSSSFIKITFVLPLLPSVICSHSAKWNYKHMKLHILFSFESSKSKTKWNKQKSSHNSIIRGLVASRDFAVYKNVVLRLPNSSHRTATFLLLFSVLQLQSILNIYSS